MPAMLDQGVEQEREFTGQRRQLQSESGPRHVNDFSPQSERSSVAGEHDGDAHLAAQPRLAV
jgi:hypothetical protein